MRTFLAACWLVTLAIGAALTLWAPPFEMPDRLRPGCGWHLAAPHTRSIGVALLLTAAAGWRLFRRAQRDALHCAPIQWHQQQLFLLGGAFALILITSLLAPYGPLPDEMGSTSAPRCSPP